MGRGRGGDRLPCRHVARRERSEDRGDPRLRRAVDLEASDPASAFVRLESLIAETGRTLVHPFDDPLVLAGQGTVALELLEDAPEVETLVVPVGGGGLVAGIAAAAPDRACSPSSRTAPRRARRSRGRPPRSRHARLDRRRALGAVRRANALAVLQAHDVESVLVSEEEIEEAFRFLYERASWHASPAAAVGVAAVLAGKVGDGAIGRCCLWRKRSRRNCLCYPGPAMKTGIHPEYVDARSLLVRQ